MSDLQLMLLAASGVVVVGVLAYNKWQEWRHKKLAAKVFQADQPDVLMRVVREAVPQDAESPVAPEAVSLRGNVDPVLDLERREPSLQAPVFSVPLAAEETGDWVEEPLQFPAAVPQDPALSPSADQPAEASLAASTQSTASVARPDVPRDWLCAESDAAVLLALLAPKSAAEIVQAAEASLAQIQKPVYWLGCTPSGRWVPLTAELSGEFSQLWLVLQLADRQGPVNELDVHTVRNAAQELAAQWNAVVDVSDLDTAMLRGRQLDQFCAEVDLQIGVNLVARLPFAGTKLRALAEAAGMVLNHQGAFERRDDDGREQFSVSNLEETPLTQESLRTLKTHGLTFVLDVPRVAEAPLVFDHMLRLIRQFAEALHAEVVDDHRKPLTDAQLHQIRQQFVVQPQIEMNARRLPPGSPLAMRVFG